MRGLLHRSRQQWAVALVCVLSWTAATSQYVQASAISPATRVAANTIILKPDVRGLEDIGGLPSGADAPYLNGTVADETWAALQPTLADNQSNTIVHPNKIDTLIASLQKWSAYANLRLKIRIFTGNVSPSWTMSLGGPSFQMNDFSCAVSPTPSGCNGGALTYSFPRWWSADYQTAYDRFQQALGAAYDSNPLIDEVSSPRCMSIWAEPFVRPWDSWSMTSLLNAGYTEAADIACQEQQLTSQAASWPHTTVAVAVNYYTNIYWKNAVATRSGDLAATIAILKFCRQTLGNQCLFQNNELGSAQATPGNPNYSPIYPLLQQFGSPLSFQMDVPSHLMGVPLGTVLSLAQTWGANSVEIQTPYFTTYQPSYFAPYNVAVSANPWGQNLTQTPVPPFSLTTPQLQPTSLTLQWAAAVATSAGGAIASYRVYRDGAIVGASTSTTFADSGLLLNTAHAYAVVAVDTNNNTSGASVALNIKTPIPSATISSLAPGTGPVTGMALVTVLGAGFTTAVSMFIGTGFVGVHPCPPSPASPCFTVVNDTELQVLTPAEDAGSVSMTVKTLASGSATATGFQYVQPTAAISSLSPPTGSQGGGNQVTITGSNLKGYGSAVTAVYFGTVAATSFVVNWSSRVTVVVPAHPAGPVDVTVVTTSTDGTVSVMSVVGVGDQYTFV